MTQEIERLGCPFCGAQPQEYSGDSDFLECSNEDCDLHGVEIQEDYWQARARVGKGEVDLPLIDRIKDLIMAWKVGENLHETAHAIAALSAQAKPVEVGELVEYLCCNTNLFSNDIEEAAQAILNKYNVTEKL